VASSRIIAGTVNSRSPEQLLGAFYLEIFGEEMIKSAVLGATGYVGQELVRLLAQHPDVQLTALTTQTYGGKNITDVFPHMKGSLTMTCTEESLGAVANECDVVFIALPHGQASYVVTAEILSKTKVIDMGADFRLKDAASYVSWYNTEHGNEDLLPHATYGLTEWQKAGVASAQLVANPGCYATASALALSPLLASGLVDTQSIIIDAKSGVSGAGRAATQAVHFNECNETLKAYGVGTHRHTPEIEQQLGQWAPGMTISFTPHLVPMNRGILVTAYAKLLQGVEAKQIDDAFALWYADKPFIRLSAEMPETRWVKGSNYCDIGWKVDPRTNRVVVIAALDNLMKGAAGQAVQNMNVMFGLDETRGLTHVPIFPV
jgi:N-acetyl-gamma-glutamyl-phosphate reductase